MRRYLPIAAIIILISIFFAVWQTFAADENKKIQNGFDMFTKQYDPLSLFHQTTCDAPDRARARSLGERAYHAFTKNIPIDPDRRFDYCGNGFYGGFIGAFADDQKMIVASEFRRFCDSIAARPHAVPETLRSCLRGIAQGITELFAQKRNDVTAAIDFGLHFCEKSVKENEPLEDCNGGVFNGLAVLYGQSFFKPDETDPLKVCGEQQKKESRSACYRSLTGFLLRHYARNDFLKASAYVETIADRSLAQTTMDNLAIRAAHTTETERMTDDEIIETCRSASSLAPSCIVGFAAGFKNPNFSDPKNHRGIQLCSNVLLTQEEEAACFTRIAWIASQEYNDPQRQLFCSSLPIEHRGLCSQ